MYPPVLSEFKSHTANIQSDRSINAFGLRDLKNDRLVGYFEIGSIDMDNRSGRLGRFLMDPSMRGQGLGQVAMRVIENQFFGNELLHRFELLVATDNLPAIACYQKVGFQTEGILRESRRFGNEWRAVQIMGLLRNEWETAQ